MPSKKITALTSLGAAPATGDKIPIVDVSDTADSSAGTTKHVLVSDLTGISDRSLLVANAAVVDNDFLRVDGTSVEGRSAAEVLSDISGVSSANIVGVQDMWVPAASMRPAATNPCADITSVDSGGNSGPDLQVLDFDTSSDEHAQFSVAMPKSWDGGNITFSAYWIGLAATTGVAWGLQVKALGDGEDINVAYGAAVVVTDDSQGSATEINVSAASGTIACSGADGDILFCQIFRDVSDGNDDMAGDARLVGIKINYTTSALNDA